MELGLRHSVGVMLLRIVFGCYLVITVLVTAIQLYFEYGNVEKRVVIELYNVGRSFEDGLISALWSLDSDAMQSILVGVAKIETVAGVKITNTEDKIEAANGVYVLDDYDHRFNRLVETEKNTAHEIFINNAHAKGIYYEYDLKLYFSPVMSKERELIGTVHFYATRDIVLDRFKNSFFLILINALIKTVALWIIFIFFARRLLSRPLLDLTTASASVSREDLHSEEEIERLKKIANANRKDELKALALSFLTMRENVLERLHNLNELNKIGLILTQTQNQESIYEEVYRAIKIGFGIDAAAVCVDGQNIWVSPDFYLKTHFTEETLDVFFQKRAIIYRANMEAIYTETLSKSEEALNQEIGLTNIPPVLYFPINVEGGTHCEIWFFGKVEASRLSKKNTLSIESESFLLAISRMIHASLTNLKQRKIIEHQKYTLEERVQERTQELKKVNEDLMHRAVHDPLTELPNRILFNNRLSHQIDISSRENSCFAVASIDLSEFKTVNDTYGHDAGDAVLMNVAQRFSNAVRKSDTLARMGGDEYAAILTGINDPSAAKYVVQNIVDSLIDPVTLPDGTNVYVNANIGVSLYPTHGSDPDLLFKYADIAMYQAKRAGLGFAVFDKDKNSREKDYLQFMHDMEHSIERNELRLHYQPILSLTTNKPIAFEALLRWEHHSRGLIPPDQFIPHAERTFFIMPMTLWVVETACKQCVEWRKKGLDITVSVNISPRIFSSTTLPDQLKKIVNKHGLLPEYLKLEITESTAMARPDEALKIISNLSEMGFQISIDDFGTGYSSLSYLTKLPVDELKIDRSFLMDDSANKLVVVRTVIDLSHTLNLHVVAEGIENQQTMDMLLQAGCDAVQGYYICRPALPEKITDWLIEKSYIEE